MPDAGSIVPRPSAIPVAALPNTATLSAGMAHEIRNALVAARTLVDLLKEGRTSGELLELADQELRRADALVAQLLRLGSLEASPFGPVRLNELVQHTSRLIAHRAQACGVRIELDCSATIATIEGDAHQLQQVLLNLCFNALDAMPGGGELRLRTELVPAADDPTQMKVQITVQDTGAGIPPALRERIFDPFFTTKAHGTGLGLAVSHRILQEHGAAIEVGSREGKGTTFFLRFEPARRA